MPTEKPWCQDLMKIAHREHSPYHIGANGILVRLFKLDSTLQVVVPESLKANILDGAHYSKLSGRPEGSKVYYNVRRELCWPNMVNDIFRTAGDCKSRVKIRGSVRSHQNYSKLFLAAGPLELLAIDLLGLLSRTYVENHQVLMITDRF